MKFAASRPARRRLAAGALALTALVGATGCSAVSPVATALSYSGSDGIGTDVDGFVGVRNLAMVGDGDGGPARLIGTVNNLGDAAASYTFSAEGGGEVSVDVAPGEPLRLEDPENELVLDRGDAWAGENVPVTISAGGESTTLQVPVLSAAQEQYRDLLPEGEEATEEDLVGHLDEESHHYGSEGGH